MNKTDKTKNAESDDKWDIFIAHAGGDTDAAVTLYKLLHRRAQVFLDKRCLKPGDLWDEKLPEAQSKSLITVVLASSKTEKAFYQKDEIAAAIKMSRDDKNKHRVVPVFLDDESQNNQPYGLSRIHSILATNAKGLEDAAMELLNLLNELKPSPNKKTATRAKKN